MTSNHPLAQDLDHILEHTQSLWPQLSGQPLFITGGTGFYGTWLVESLAWAESKLKLGLRATILSRSPEKFFEQNPVLRQQPCFQFVAGDIRDFTFPQGQFPYVIHAATSASEKLNIENPLLMLDTIVEGTRRTLDFAAQAGTRHFLHTSSGAVYGDLPRDLEKVPESYAGGPNLRQPKWAYGEAKRLAELTCSIYDQQRGIACKNVRCFATVGPRLPLHTHFAMGNFIADALADRDLVVRGDGTPIRSYIYIADLVIWLWHVLVRGDHGCVYNVGSDRGYSIAELAHLVRDVLAPQRAVRILGQPIPQQLASRYVPSVEQARHDLGLVNRVPLEEAIRRTAAWERRRTAAPSAG